MSQPRFYAGGWAEQPNPGRARLWVQSQVVVCRIAQAAFLVPDLLKSPVPGGLVRVRFAVSLPVAGIFGPPLLRTVIADLAVNRICDNLVAMVFSLPPLLALRRRADSLLRMKSAREEQTLAEPARPLKHSSRVARFCFNQKYAGII